MRETHSFTHARTHTTRRVRCLRVSLGRGCADPSVCAALINARLPAQSVVALAQCRILVGRVAAASICAGRVAHGPCAQPFHASELLHRDAKWPDITRREIQHTRNATICHGEPKRVATDLWERPASSAFPPLLLPSSACSRERLHAPLLRVGTILFRSGVKEKRLISRAREIQPSLEATVIHDSIVNSSFQRVCRN